MVDSTCMTRNQLIVGLKFAYWPLSEQSGLFHLISDIRKQPEPGRY